MNENFEYDVFLSYSEKEKDYAKKIFQKMESTGLRVFWSKKILKKNIGESWFNQIEYSLMKSKHFVLICSPLSVKSEWVKAEYETFHNECYMKNNKERKLIILKGNNFNMSLVPGLLKRLQIAESIDEITNLLLIKNAMEDTNKNGNKSVSDFSGGEKMSDKKEENIIPLFGKHVKKPTRKKIKDSENSTFSQLVVGNNNITIGVTGDLKITPQKTKSSVFNIKPPENSIGNDSLLKKRINDLFNDIAEARVKRLGETQKKVRQVMYANFKRDFEIKGSYSEIWTWPKAAAEAIIKYWEDKWNNTIPGRIQKAAQKEDYLHTRPHLYRLEKNYLSQIGLKQNDMQVKDYLKRYFGVTTHKKLTHIEHYLWVKHLETILNEIYEQE